MNRGQYIVNMQHTLNQLEKLTRSSTEHNYRHIRDLCDQMEDHARNLWFWSTKEEDNLSLTQWQEMDRKYRKEKGDL